MSFYKRIMAQRPPCTTEQRVRGFVQALETGDVKALVEYNFSWVASHCFTATTRIAWREAAWQAWEVYKAGKDLSLEALRAANDPDYPALAQAWIMAAMSPDVATFRVATAPAFLSLSMEEGKRK